MTAETIGPNLRNLLPRLWSFAFRLSGTSGLAEDLTDRTFVRLVGLVKVSVTEQITLALALREMYTVWQCDFGGAYFHARERESSGAARRSSERKLTDAIQSLAGLERAVVLLAHLERLSVRDIASITNEPVGRVINAMTAAHQKVSQHANFGRIATGGAQDESS
jgi:RNA polymerase sigma-70 factor, ECF subfamily